MKRKIKPNNINLKSFESKSSLNPKIWNDKGIKPEVRHRLLEIADEFVGTLEFDILPKDVIVIGSITGYNWSKYSDIDLHILYDFSKINEDIDLVKRYCDSKKVLWNNQHNLTIYGYEVELYV